MGFLWGLLFGALGFVAATIWSVVTFLAGVIASAVGTITYVVSAVAMGIGQAIAVPLEELRYIVMRTAETVREMTANLIEGFADTVGDVTKPVLEPIRDALAGVKNYVEGIETWIKTTLKPLEEVIGTVEEISGYFMVYKTLAGIRNVSDGLDVIADKVGLETAAKIAELMRMIVDIGTSTVDYVQDVVTAFDQKVLHADERIREANEAGLNELRLQLDEAVLGIRANLSFQETRFDRQVRAIERRLVDLPWFSKMLVRTLR